MAKTDESTAAPAPAIRPNQVEVIAHRNFTLASTLGHVIKFEKGKVIPIPRILLPEAQMQGVTLANEADTDTTDEDSGQDNIPHDPAKRKADIKAAVAKLEKRNIREDFTAVGAPKVTAVEKIIGYNTSSKELNPILQEINDERQEAKSGG